MKAEIWLARVRRVVIFLVLGLILYGWRRFEVITLPAGALSPLYGIHAGDRLLVDRHADPTPGEADWLFRDAHGTLLLGRAKEPPPGARLEGEELWIEFERPVEGLEDSRTLGPVRAEALEGRVVLVLPR